MPKSTSPEVIEALWRALKEPPRSSNAHMTNRITQNIIEVGWASIPDLEDLFEYADARLNQREFGVQQLAELAEVNVQWVFPRPKLRSKGVVGSQRMHVSEVAEFLIFLERLGFLLDPAPLVCSLRPAVLKRLHITQSELSIFWFETHRHRNAPVSVETKAEISRTVDRFVTLRGYKCELGRDEEKNPIYLKVTPPKYRRLTSPKETLCPLCKYKWFRGDPDSSASHRKEHKRRLSYLDPQPHPKFIAGLKPDVDAELVISSSPVWKHREIYRRAFAFKRELGFDFVQWSFPRDTDPNARGFLFVDERAVIVGACAFRLRDWANHKRWGLQWIWVCPKYRRSGVLQARWIKFREVFGSFYVEPPVSDGMAAFIRKQGDENLME